MNHKPAEDPRVPRDEPTADLDRPAFSVVDRTLRLLRSRHFRPHIPHGAEVLDFGCGEANWFLHSNSNVIARGVGVDPSLRRVGEIGTVTGYQGTLDEFVLSAPESRFDVATMVAVIEHLSPDTALNVLGVLRGLLVPRGRLVLSTPTPSSRPILEFLAYRAKIISRAEIEDHKVYYDRPLLAGLLEQSGFKLESYKRFQFGLNSLAVASVQ